MDLVLSFQQEQIYLSLPIKKIKGGGGRERKREREMEQGAVHVFCSTADENALMTPSLIYTCQN